MSDTVEQAARMIRDGDPEGMGYAQAHNIASALAEAGLLAESAVQDWVMIPADQVHDEWAVERPDPVDHQPRYDRFPTLDAALAERWGSDRAVHRVATGWEPVDPDVDELEGRAER